MSSPIGSYRGTGIFYTTLTAADAGNYNFSGTIPGTTSNVYLDGFVVSGQSGTPTYVGTTTLNNPSTNTYTFTTTAAAPAGADAFTDAVFAPNGNTGNHDLASTPSVFDSRGSATTHVTNVSDQANLGSDVSLGYLSLGSGGSSDTFTAQDVNPSHTPTNRGGFGVLVVDAASVAPEPAETSTIGLIGVGLGGLLLRARKRRVCEAR